MEFTFTKIRNKGFHRRPTFKNKNIFDSFDKKNMLQNLFP